MDSPLITTGAEASNGVSYDVDSAVKNFSDLAEKRRDKQQAHSRSLAVLIAGLVHALFVAIAVLIVFAGPAEPEPDLIVSAAPVDKLDRPNQKQLSQSSSRQKPSPPSSRASKVITAAAPSEFTVPLIEQQVDDPNALAGLGVGAYGDGFGTGGTGAGMGEGQFFGDRTKGNQFVYVIDGSSSMGRNDKWETCKRELIKSVRELKPKQRFYVYIFSRNMVRMFDSDQAPTRLEAATPANVRKMEKWLDNYQLQSGTYPRQSVAEALEELKPDVVFLLSDGQFANGDNTEQYVLDAAKQGQAKMPKINTIAFQTEDGQEVLKRIAKATGGKYTYVRR